MNYFSIIWENCFWPGGTWISDLANQRLIPLALSDGLYAYLNTNMGSNLADAYLQKQSPEAAAELKHFLELWDSPLMRALNG